MPRSNDRVPIVENDELSEGVQAVSPSVAVAAQRDNELDPAPSGCGASMCCNPSSGLHRFIALIFMCLLGFGKLSTSIYFISKIRISFVDNLITDNLNGKITKEKDLIEFLMVYFLFFCFIRKLHTTIVSSV